jgi:hypothetical protein
VKCVDLKRTEEEAQGMRSQQSEIDEVGTAGTLINVEAIIKVTSIY